MAEPTTPIEDEVNTAIPMNCIDRVLPDELQAMARQVAMEENNVNYAPGTRAAIEFGKRWKPGKTLGVYFMNGESVVQKKVAAIFPEWSKHANINFQVTSNPRAEIRISFLEAGSWSYIGTDALLVPSNKPTMNYGWLKPDTADSEYERVVIHEFGHALGLIHEHQNPATDIPWNKEAVYQYYSGPPNYWSRQQTDRNLFQTYTKEITQFTRFDRDSIMLYPIEQRFTIGNFEVGWNKTLSALDKEFIGQQYPFETKAENEITVDGVAATGTIGKLGEVDIYTFVIKSSGSFTIETHGKTDVSLSIFGPDNDTKLVAEDDDSGRALNAKVTKVLRSGLYTVQVRHFSQSRTGDYSVTVKRNA